MVRIIKLYFDDLGKEQQIRRLAVTSDIVSNFVLLLERIKTVLQLPSSENLQVKWRDSENDFILISSNDELAQALANAEEGLLRLYTSLKKEKSDNVNIPNVVKELHPYIVCDGCDGLVFGVRYKCLQCENYDLCSSCDAAGKHATHDMIKLVKPVNVPREYVLTGTPQLLKFMCQSVNPTGKLAFSETMEQAPKAGNSLHSGNVNSQPNSNTVPESAPSSSTDNAPGSSSQQKEKSAPKFGTQQCPFGDLANFPQAFMNCLQNDFVDAPKLIHQGLNQVLKAVQGTIEVVDHSIYNPEFRRSQEKSDNQTGSPTSSVPAQATESTTVENPSTTTTPKQAPEVIAPPNPTTNENVPLVDLVEDNDKSANAAEGIDEITVDAECEGTANAVEDSSACVDGWTLLEGGDANKMDCTTEPVVTSAAETAATNATEAVVTNAPEREVTYPDLMEVESNQERNGDYTLSTDPLIVSALVTMGAMGFTNEGGWLERLLISKQGNINDALEALYPSIRH